MAVVLHIDGAVRHARAGTIRYSRRFRETGVGYATVKTSEYVCEPGMHFRIFDSWGEHQFGGPIDKIEYERISPGQPDQWQHITAVSWEFRLTRRLCPDKAYRNMNALQIALDLIAFVADESILVTGGPSGYLENGAPAADIGVISFVGKTVWEALTVLSEMSHYVTGVDPQAYFFFRQPIGTSSGWIFDTSSNNFHAPLVEKNRVDYYNRIRLGISWDAYDPATQGWQETIVGDGVTQNFIVLQGGTGPEISIDHIQHLKLNGVDQSVVDLTTLSPTNGQWGWEYGTGKIFQNPVDPPITASDSLVLHYYPVGGNIITVQNTAEIAARQSIEDDILVNASGKYEGYFEDQEIRDQAVGTARANALLKEHCPNSNGAPLGTMPARYELSVWGYLIDADKLQPGYFINFDHVAPHTGGNKQLLIETVDGQIVGCGDPSDAMNPGGFLELKLGCMEYIRPETGTDYFRKLMSGGSVERSSPVGGRSQEVFLATLAEIIPGITTGGLIVGLMNAVRSFPFSCTLSHVTLEFPATDRPTVTDVEIDILLNGTSIFNGPLLTFATTDTAMVSANNFTVAAQALWPAGTEIQLDVVAADMTARDGVLQIVVNHA